MILFFKIFPVVIGILCIIIAWIPERKKLKSPVFAEAEIIDSVTQKMFRKHSETLFYAPVIRYQTEQGIVTATDRTFVPEWQYRYQKGDKIKICYEKLNPQIFWIQNDSRSELRKILGMTLGIGILTAYAVLWMQVL